MQIENVRKCTKISHTVVFLVTPLAKGGYVFGNICLSVNEQHYSKSYEWIVTKFYGGVHGDKNEN